MVDKVADNLEDKGEETEFENEFGKIADAKESSAVEDDDPKLEPEDGKAAAADGDDTPGDKKDGDTDGKPVAAKEDPYVGMSPEVKERVIALEKNNTDLTHKISSDAGRVSAFQRKVNNLETEIQDIRQGSTAGEQPSNADIAEAMKGSDEQWEQFRQDYPEVAGAIDSRLEKAGQATQDKVESTLAPVKAKQEQNDLSNAQAAEQAASDVVTEKFPTWTEAVKTPEFMSWLDTQPPGVAALAGSDDTEDASALIGMYDDFLVASDKPTLKAVDPGPGVEETEGKTTEAEKLEARRKQQLADGTTVKSKSAQISPGEAEGTEFEDAFAFHAKRKEAKRRSA